GEAGAAFGLADRCAVDPCGPLATPPGRFPVGRILTPLLGGRLIGAFLFPNVGEHAHDWPPTPSAAISSSRSTTSVSSPDASDDCWCWRRIRRAARARR